MKQSRFRSALCVCLAMLLTAAGCTNPASVTAPPARVDRAPPAEPMNVEQARTRIAAELARLRGSDQLALAQVAQLTDADIAVFADNPRMLQTAGWQSSDTIILVIVIAFVVVLVVLAANGSGFVMVG